MKPTKPVTEWTVGSSLYLSTIEDAITGDRCSVSMFTPDGIEQYTVMKSIMTSSITVISGLIHPASRVGRMRRRRSTA